MFAVIVVPATAASVHASLVYHATNTYPSAVGCGNSVGSAVTLANALIASPWPSKLKLTVNT